MSQRASLSREQMSSHFVSRSCHIETIIMSVLYREAKLEDTEELFKLLVESTGGSTRLTVDKLRDDLFSINSNTSVEVLMEDPELDFDIDRLQSNVPVARAVVAEVDGFIAGYLIFHGHWTPWKGHIASLDDIFTRPSMRLRGIGRGLVHKVTEIAKAEGYENFLFTVGRMSSDLRKYLDKEGSSYWYRDDNTDWSVLRIDFSKRDRTGAKDVQRGY